MFPNFPPHHQLFLRPQHQLFQLLHDSFQLDSLVGCLSSGCVRNLLPSLLLLSLFFFQLFFSFPCSRFTSIFPLLRSLFLIPFLLRLPFILRFFPPFTLHFFSFNFFLSFCRFFSFSISCFTNIVYSEKSSKRKKNCGSGERRRATTTERYYNNFSNFL